MTRRSPSILSWAGKMALAGVAVRVTQLDDGSVTVDTLTGGNFPPPIASIKENEARLGDEAINGAFSKGVRKSRGLQRQAR
ncbi:hypothetical protein GCM10011273_03620 [Asticcacaulis endophyticus]|uniref:Uncharacterized protein n=1 Tax=Asticcacaulis endophyticus TaxID=1395890 RepID=A0A918PUV5_9CAUL|nr:hypothetical protein GCM10011273_03620 [Asticcacaulis endophyticus]